MLIRGKFEFNLEGYINNAVIIIKIIGMILGRLVNIIVIAGMCGGVKK